MFHCETCDKNILRAKIARGLVICPHCGEEITALPDDHEGEDNGTRT